jgi:hypothetical protein
MELVGFSCIYLNTINHLVNCCGSQENFRSDFSLDTGYYSHFILDAIGVDLKFWVYPVQFLPITPRALPFDVFMVGITFMLLYQFFNSWRSYLIALFIMALVFAFIGEPISKRLNLVYYIKWKYYYSFLYYVSLGVTVRTIVIKCKQLSENK